jgi:RNA polymerase sigma factor (sigma-70 family)
MYLVRDSAAADDVVQQTWIAAMTNPPCANESPKPWLGAVVRNAVRARFRSDSRRSNREIAATDDSGVAPSAEELLQNVEMQQRLAAAILKLGEPYRTTVLLRFYEELSSAQIARRLAVPEGTVRWRLKEALRLLRDELAGKESADIRSWIAAFAPLAPPAPASAGATSTHFLQRYVTMKFAIASIIVVGSATTVVVATHQPGDAAVAPVAKTAAPTLTAAAPAPRALAAPTRKAKLNPAEHAALVARISQSNHASSAPSQTLDFAGAVVRPGAQPPATVRAAEMSKLDKHYIRASIEELTPFIAQCYENALATNPDLKGTVSVRFSIVAAPDIGGAVGESEINDKESTITDPEVRQCIQETMYAAQFPAPEAGGEIIVHYPFQFATVE